MSLPATDTENTRQTEPCQRFEGHTNWVRGVIYLQGGQQITTCSDDGSLRVWNLQTGKQIAIWQDGDSPVNSIALSVDGKKMVSGSDDDIVRLWSIETGEVIARWTGHTKRIWSVCWNQDGVGVLSGSEDGTARVWNVETGKTILQISTKITEVYAANFSPDSTLIATGGESGDAADDERIKIWDANTGKLVAILKGHTLDVTCLAWTANGRTLISGSSDETIMIWDTSTCRQLAVLTGHTSSVRGIAISPNGRILASASWDDTARLWNLDSGQPIDSPLQHPDSVRCVSFSTDGTLLATGCDDDNAYTLDISAIVKEAGLEELLDVDKSFLYADATRRPVQHPKNATVISTGFFAATSDVPDRDPHITPSISPPVIPEGTSPIPLLAVPEDAPPDVQPSLSEQSRSHFFNWFHSNTSTRPTILQRAQLPFFKRPQRHNNEAIAVPEDALPEVQINSPLPFFDSEWSQRHDGVQHVPPVVDVPLNQRRHMYYTAAQARAKEARPAKKSKNPNNSAATGQRHSSGNILTTPPATPALDTITLQAGCLTRFLLRFGCVSAPRHH